METSAVLRKLRPGQGGGQEGDVTLSEVPKVVRYKRQSWGCNPGGRSSGCSAVLHSVSSLLEGSREDSSLGIVCVVWRHTVLDSIKMLGSEDSVYFMRYI